MPFLGIVVVSIIVEAFVHSNCFIKSCPLFQCYHLWSWHCSDARMTFVAMISEHFVASPSKSSFSVHMFHHSNNSYVNSSCIGCIVYRTRAKSISLRCCWKFNSYNVELIIRLNVYVSTGKQLNKDEVNELVAAASYLSILREIRQKHFVNHTRYCVDISS